MKTIVKERVEPLVLSVDLPPEVHVGGHRVRLDIKSLTAEDVVEFVNWAAPADQVIRQPLDAYFEFTFQDVDFKVRAVGNQVTVSRV
jgi:hypothetical protein